MSKSKSNTRFTVEGQKQFDDAAEALAEAKRMLYVSPSDEARALETMRRGESVTLTYGFVSVCITPPDDALNQYLKDKSRPGQPQPHS